MATPDSSIRVAEPTDPKVSVTDVTVDLGETDPEPSQVDLKVDMGDEPEEWKKYSSYKCKTDTFQNDKSSEIKLCDFSRPHMRAFHCNWWSFFVAFCVWFAVAPLLSEIRTTLKLSKQEVWTSSIFGVAGTIFMRFLLGPMCDKYGGRTLMAIILCLAAIPTSCVGFVNSATGLSVLRLFIGIAGSSFVMCQYWTSSMFTKEVVGVANGMAAGWGNLGGGVIQLVVGTLLFPLFKNVFYGDDPEELAAEKAWRTVCIVPAFVSFVTGIVIYKISDDSPKGNYWELKKFGSMPEISAAASFRSGAINLNSWVLFLQYACCFGVELTMNNAAALYFTDEFAQSTESAAAIASIFGWMNLFARGAGGYFSDKCNARFGMRGRIAIQTVLLLGEGMMVLVFSQMGSLTAAILVMVIFSLFVQACEGSTFGIVPYVDPPATGAISGIVGAGGNVGAVGFGLAFRQLDYEQAFLIMGFTILASAVTSIFLIIKGHSALFWGHEDISSKSGTIKVPEPDHETADDVNA